MNELRIEAALVVEEALKLFSSEAVDASLQLCIYGADSPLEVKFYEFALDALDEVAA